MATQVGGFGEGPMDQALLRRYAALFVAYDFGGNEVVKDIKNRLAAEIVDGAQLRPDAAHLLLVLADQMILRPYAAPITSFIGQIPGDPPPVTQAEIRRRLDSTLDKILAALNQANAPRPRSSHSVLKAIETLWPDVANVFQWA